jgi:hypothetical protein
MQARAVFQQFKLAFTPSIACGGKKSTTRLQNMRIQFAVGFSTS